MAYLEAASLHARVGGDAAADGNATHSTCHQRQRGGYPSPSAGQDTEEPQRFKKKLRGIYEQTVLNQILDLSLVFSVDLASMSLKY
jgi:hypothetical protein